MPSKQHALRFGFAYLCMLVAVQAVQWGAATVIGRAWPALVEAEGYLWLMSTLPLYGVGLPLCLGLLPRAEGRPEGRPMRPRDWLLSLVVALGLMVIGNLIGNALMHLVGLLRGEPVVNPLSEIMLDADPYLTAVVTVIVAPMGEELLFRRLIIDRTRRYGEGTAVVISALMFGAFHLNFHQFFYATLIGLVLGYLYVKTGRLREVVALHAAINLLGGVVAPALLRGMAPVLDAFAAGGFPGEDEMAAALPAMLGYALYTVLLWGCALTTLLLGALCLRQIKLGEGEDARVLRRSPTVAAFFVICALLTLWGMR